MDPNKLSIQTSIIVGSIIIGLSIIISGGNGGGKNIENKVVQEQAPQKIEVPPITESDHITGSKSPKIIIVEYSDMECPFCKTFHKTLKQVVGEYGDKVAWVYRHFPLEIHPKAKKEAEATECVVELGGNSMFWKYIDKIFEITPSNNKLEESELTRVAKELGLDVSKFEKCLSSGKYSKKIEEAIQSGLQAGARGTPYSLFVTGKGVVPVSGGAVSFEKLKLQIDKLLAE